MLILAIALVVGFAVYMIYSWQRLKKMSAVPESDKIITLTDKNYKHQLGDGLITVDFWAEWCMPCKIMGPVLNELAGDEKFKARVAKLNVEDFPAISQQFAIKGIPTLIVFKNGKEVNRIVGVKPKDFIMKQVNASA